ncbi:MAG TPA: glycosyltransferase family 2 protein [Thermoanaerobaculia bacterium]|nr:glycosyltransferase family 2 protein [Thermoanaerobaculia bacterium]
MTHSGAGGRSEDRTEVSVVLPVYRNRATLDELYLRLSRALVGASLPYELIFVNDACPEGSGAALAELAARDPHVRGIFLSKNVGQQRAAWVGLSAARGAWAVVMDADLQDPPEAIPALLSTATGGVDAVLAAWTGRYEGTGRLLTSRAFKTLREKLTGYPRDAGMFLALRRPLVEEILRRDVSHPFLPTLVGLSGRRFVTVPVERKARPGGGSAYSPAGLLLRALRELAFILRCRVGPGASPRRSF